MTKIRIIDLEKENTAQEILDNKDKMFLAVDSIENGTSKVSISNLQSYISDIVNEILSNSKTLEETMNDPQCILPLSKSKFYMSEDLTLDYSAWKDLKQTEASVLQSPITTDLPETIQLRIRYKAKKRELNAIYIKCTDSSGRVSIIDEVLSSNTTELNLYTRWLECDEGMTIDVCVHNPDPLSYAMSIYWDQVYTSVFRYSNTDYSAGSSTTIMTEKYALATNSTFTATAPGTLYVSGRTNFVTIGSSNSTSYNLREVAVLRRYKADAKNEGRFTDTAIETIYVHLIPKYSLAKTANCVINYYDPVKNPTQASEIMHIYPETFNMKNDQGEDCIWYLSDTTRIEDPTTGAKYYRRYQYEYRFINNTEYNNYYKNNVYRPLMIQNNSLYDMFRTVAKTTDRKLQVGLIKKINDDYGEVIDSITDKIAAASYTFAPYHLEAGLTCYIVYNSRSNSLKNTGTWKFKFVFDNPT